MNIRPIDMQTLIPRATDAGKVQQQANEQPILQQQQFEEQLRQLNDQKQHQVQKTPQTEGGKVSARKPKDEEKEHHKNQQSSSDNTKSVLVSNDDSENITSRDAVLGHFIDIKT